MTEITREELISTITEAFLRAGYGQVKAVPNYQASQPGPLQPTNFDGYGQPSTTALRRPDNADAYTAYARQIEAELAKASAKPSAPTFEVGDIVALKTGGSAMTIARLLALLGHFQ